MGLTIVLTTAASANLKTPCGRSKTLVPSANRFTSHAPETASSVFPVAMASEVAMFPAVVAFTKNAQTKIAGQMRYRKRSSTDNAMAVGGQSSDAIAVDNAK